MNRRPRPAPPSRLLPAFVTVLSVACKGAQNATPTPPRPPTVARPGNPPEPIPPPSPPTPPPVAADDAGRMPVVRVDPDHPPMARGGAMRVVQPRPATPAPAPAPRPAGRGRAAASAAPAPLLNQPPPEHPLLEGREPGLYVFHDHAAGAPCNAIPDPEFQVALTQARTVGQPTTQPTP